MNSNKSSKWAISDFVEIIGGGTPKTSISEYWNGSIPWLSVKDFGNDDRYVFETEKTITNEGLNNSSTKLLQKDDIIISARGTVGELAMLPFPMAFNQSCYGIRPKDDSIDKTFLYYLLRNSVQLLRKNTHGSVFDTITRDTFKGIEVEVPSIEEQVKIAGILSSLDDKIAENKKINHHLAEIAKSIFDSYFIDLSPYDGVMPDDWQLSNLTGIANYLNGLAMQKHRPQSNEQGLPVLKIKELRQGFTDSTSDLCSSNIRRDYIIHDGDVIFSWSGSLLVDFWTGGDCGLNQHLFKVSSTYDKWFYYAWTKHHLDRFVKMAADRATTMGHIKRDALEKAEVLIPSNKDYQEIGNKLKPIYDQIINNRVESRKLVALRDTLLPKLMSGEISVTD
ncbi:restriction endonuclease subunit S [Leuconostoc gelidum]|uniref:restriction endonuclease subunit S n=1 Tax=Leuconostoc gelidum TaxID=1244 RepID=UPI001CC58EA5|nr:restriction endonuclease subunit S [Leuconostoc gelidum]